MTITRILRPSLVTVASFALVTAACSNAEVATPDRLDRTSTRVDQDGPQLLHVVSLDPQSPVSGTNVAVRSVLRNTSPAAMDLTSRICGLDYEGTLTLTHPPEVMKCAGVSATTSLAPGDSIVVLDLMRVTNPAGTYELRVRHALGSERWASVSVVVRAP